MTENDYCLLYDIASKRIEELEKENAEQKDQLTKAKELLERLVTVCKIVPLGTNYDVVKKAEQFLQEIDISNAIQKANEGLNLDKIAEEVENDLKEGCPDILCEDCTKEDCNIRKLGLVPNKEIEK